MSIELAIIILNWNGYEDTQNCLDSIYKNQHISFQVFLVDNGSTDDNSLKFKEKFQNLDVIELPENIGFAAGNNVGIKAALKNEPEAVLLLNNDTVLSANCLEKMFLYLKSYNKNPDNSNDSKEKDESSLHMPLAIQNPLI